MHLAVYGGSFNPPHVAHQLAVAYVLSTSRVDRVLVLPTAQHAFGKALCAFEDRVEMTRLAMRHFGSAVEVSTLESQLPVPSRTLRTLTALKERHAGASLSLVVGADILKEAPQWMGWDRITQMASLIVLGRPGFEPTGTLTLPDVSSTVVRARLAAGEPVDHLLDHAVVEYIHKHNLFGGNA